MNRLSRSDILFAAVSSGLDWDDAETLMYGLSPECQTVPEDRVKRAIAFFLSYPDGKV